MPGTRSETKVDIMGHDCRSHVDAVTRPGGELGMTVGVLLT